MKKFHIYILLMLCAIISGCDRKYDSPIDEGRVNQGKDDPTPKMYIQQYDQISDQGQYWHPDAMKSVATMPTSFCQVHSTNLEGGNPNVPNGAINAGYGAGVQHHLLCQSFAGLNDRALMAGTLTVGAWLDPNITANSYKNYMRIMKVGIQSVAWAGNMMTFGGYAGDDQFGVMKNQPKKYVLTDVVANPESGVVAVVASHVHNAFIVDKRDEQFFKDNGYTIAYDASSKSTVDSWNEFKDKCNNGALVVLPVHSGELADFAIANGLFVINLNKKFNTSSGGQNVALFKEVLASLKPNSPVYGWEPGVGEDEFVNLVSKSGNMMVALGEYNIPYFSANYAKRQGSSIAKVINPQDIDYSKDKKFVSFYMSDGAHAGWMMNGFVENFYSDINIDKVSMGFGITANAAMIDPIQFNSILDKQSRKSTLIESFGGGYFYSDNFGEDANRPALLASLAKKVASHMRQRRVKILEQIAWDPMSEKSKEAYQAFVDANDQLEGIIAIQYAPSYAQCGGQIMWVTNKQGYDIPVVTVSYSIWNMGANNTPKDGTPTYIAKKLNEKTDSPFSAVIVHAWSTFTDTGESQDEIAENAANGTVRGPSAAEMCARRLNSDVEVVNMQELVWRIRMKYRKEQTEKFLKEYF